MNYQNILNVEEKKEKMPHRTSFFTKTLRRLRYVSKILTINLYCNINCGLDFAILILSLAVFK